MIILCAGRGSLFSNSFYRSVTNLIQMTVKATVKAVIPFRPVNPKTRLSNLLSESEREEFTAAMLNDVVSALIEGGCSPVLLSTRPYTVSGAETVVMDLGLNEALNEYFSTLHEPVLLMMTDIALLNADAVRKMLSTDADIAIAPGRGGGTNSIFIKDPQKFRADFYGASFLDHLAVAESFGKSVEVIDSFRLSTDIDEEEDLTEVLIHGGAKSRSKKYLEELGYSLSIEKGRVGVHRRSHK